MTIKIFLDDERLPDCVSGYEDALVARNETDLWNVLRCVRLNPNCEYEISFDHDLGENEKNGKEIANILFDVILKKWIHPPVAVCVHSMNPVGAVNIMKLAQNFSNVILGGAMLVHRVHISV